MILPDFILIEETIEKYNYDPKTFKGQKFYHLPVVRTCFICHSIYDQKFINAIYAFRKNKKCKFCANKERSIMSAESRSISMKKKYRDGLIHPMLGKIHTIETKNILSKNRMGKTFDDLYGEEKSNEIKQKLSKASTGEKNPFYNKKHNKETIEFLRENTRKSTRKGKNSNFYGKNYNKIISNDEFIKKCIFTHGNRYDYSKVEYKGRLNNIEIICKTHGPFLQKAFTHIDGSGCQKCNLSQGELKILSFLKENRIDFIQQFKFNNCKRVKPLPFDFFLPNKNICIEYDGEFHYLDLGFNNLQETQENDKIKNDFCQEFGLDLIRISYLEKEMINDILLKILK